MRAKCKETESESQYSVDEMVVPYEGKKKRRKSAAVPTRQTQEMWIQDLCVSKGVRLCLGLPGVHREVYI